MGESSAPDVKVNVDWQKGDSSRRNNIVVFVVFGMQMFSKNCYSALPSAVPFISVWYDLWVHALPV